MLSQPPAHSLTQTISFLSQLRPMSYLPNYFRPRSIPLYVSLKSIFLPTSHELFGSRDD
jgi:hypothetical protein